MARYLGMPLFYCMVASFSVTNPSGKARSGKGGIRVSTSWKTMYENACRGREETLKRQEQARKDALEAQRRQEFATQQAHIRQLQAEVQALKNKSSRVSL